MDTLQADVISLAGYKHDLAIRLWREDKLDEARPLLREAIEGAEDVERRLAYTNTLSIVEQTAGRLLEAIQLINAALPEAVHLDDKHRLAKLHMTQGINYRRLGDSTNSDDARQSALIHFAGAGGFFEELGDTRHVSMVENNLANVLIDLNKPEDALTHSNTAIKINECLGDRVDEDEILYLQFLDTRAKIKLASNKADEAIGDALKSAYGLYQFQEANFLKTSLRTVEKCIKQLDYEEEGRRLQAALDKVNGHPKRAADLLNMNHGSFCRLVDKHPEIRRKPKLKPRGRSCKTARPS